MKAGRSFKGAARYYLHDKDAATDERVAWVEIFNLPTADPDRAWRMMAHTAIAQSDLKEAAGIKATGRKLENPVFSYALSWHPTETPTRREMTQAALETLKVLGLDEHQAMIVCHDDEPHPHVHIMVNRVHPHDGRAAGLSNSKRKLSEWALKYEQSRGQVFAEQRLQNHLKRLNGEKTYCPRLDRASFELKAANDNLSAAFIRAEWKRRAAALYRHERAQAAQFSARFDALQQAQKQAWAQLREQREAAIAALRLRVKSDFKPDWASLFRAERKRRKGFERRERSILGKVWNMAATAKELREGDRAKSGGDGKGGALDIVFALFNGNERIAALERKLQRARKRLMARQGEAVRSGIREIKKQDEAARNDARREFLAGVEALRRDQRGVEAAQKEAWRTYNAERRKVFRQIRERRSPDSSKSKWRGTERVRTRERRPGHKDEG